MVALSSSATFKAERARVDRALVEKMAHGDPAAAESLYRRLLPSLIALAEGILNNRTDAEDVAQEVFTVLWKKASSYQPARASVYVWAATLLRNRAIDRMRGHSRRSAYFKKVESMASIEAGPDLPHQNITHIDDANAVRTMVRRLSSSVNQVVELHFFEGLSHVEVAQRLRLPLGTAKARIRKGVMELRGSREIRGFA